MSGFDLIFRWSVCVCVCNIISLDTKDLNCGTLGCPQLCCWILAGQWKPQDGGNLMLVLHFFLFFQVRKPSYNVWFCRFLSCHFSLLSFFVATFLNKWKEVWHFNRATTQDSNWKPVVGVHKRELKFDNKNSKHVLCFPSWERGEMTA